MKSRRHLARLMAVIGLTGAITLVPTVSQGVVSVSAAPACLCAGGEFHPLTPQRVFDSRTGTLSNHDVAPLGAKPLSTGISTFDIDLLGLGGLPAASSDVLAVVVNITVTDTGANGYLTAYGKGFAPATPTSIINFGPGATVPNVSIVRPGNDGDLTLGLFGQSGTANVIVDVFGWFSTSNYVPVAPATNDGARLIPTTPSRVLDTRPGVFNVNRPSGTPLAAKETMVLPIWGVDGINPTTTDVVPNMNNITGVLLNVVGITGSSATHLSIYPNDLGGAAPTTSNLNLAPNTIKANLVFVPVGTDGSVRIFNNQGFTDVVADVVGYMQSGQDPTTRKGRVVPLSSPYRTFDTRDPQFGGVALGPGQAEDWSFADFASSVAIGPDAVGNQLAVIGNLTSAELKRQYASVPAASFLTAYPADAARPLSSNLNTVEGPPIPNMAVLKYGANNTVRVYNLAGYSHYLFDASAVVLAD
ncbi:MAG: hypothetical protein ABI949_06725 [Ilumatobacteraceae bacterium]